MATETQIQELVHKLEEGGWAKWMRLAALFAAIIYLCYAWLFKENGFKGLVNPRAFEQAEIAREIARGHGFSTKIYRPAEIWLYKQNKGDFPLDPTPDTYHAPLWPTVLAPFVAMAKSTWKMSVRDLGYVSDKVIAAVGLFFFLASVLVQFFVARRLFDQRLAYFGVGLMLVCHKNWQFSMSGLPQMLLLFLFSCATYALVRLVDEQEEAKLLASIPPEGLPAEGETAAEPGADPAANPAATVAEPISLGDPNEPPPLYFGFPWWALAAGFAFGLMALTHGLAIWVFLGALVFSVLYFRDRRWLVSGLMAGVFVLTYSPWLVRNYNVCGSPVGVAWYSGLYQVRGTESSIMRAKEPPLTGVSPTIFRAKMQTQLLGQMGNLPEELGYSLLAPVFFLSLLHRFKRPPVGYFRWGILLMWGFAVLGMIIFGLDDQLVKANDLHVLFIPLMGAYGMAYVLILWSRLEVNVRILRFAFFALLFLLSGTPFLLTLIELHAAPNSRFQWPPYLPPYVALLGTWTDEKEIIMSDMPWAVAWYADRRSLWLPMDIRDYMELNDYDLLQGRIVGMYLTPVSGYRAFLADIIKGEYKDWSPFIMRNANLRNFPLKVSLPLPIDGECIYYSDRDRWSLRED